MTTLVRLRSVTLRYPGAPSEALREVDFEMKAGERVGLVGPSGSGKSSISLLLGGLLPAGARVGGEVEVAGVEVQTASPGELLRLRRERVGWIFQQPHASMNPVRSVRSHFDETLALHGVAPGSRLERARGLLRDSGLDRVDEVLGAHPHHLSGGMAQRVAIALALVGEPELLVADEPTSALDARTQRGIVDLLRELSGERGVGLLFIAHDLALVRELCPRVVLLREGRVRADLPASEIRPDSPHEEVARIASAARHFTLDGGDRRTPTDG